MSQDAASLVAAVREKLAERHSSMDLLRGSEESKLAAARQLLTKAAGKNLTRPIGKALYASGVAAKKGLQLAGDAGEGLAEGLRLGETGRTIARRGAQAAALAGAASAGSSANQSARRRIDEFRYRHGLYRGM